MKNTIGTASPRHVELTDLTYRHIARMFAQSLPVEGEDLASKVEEYLAIIKALPASARYALRAAYIFGSKAPREEREDLFQELALKVLQVKADNERLAYAVARADWLDWWKHYKRERNFTATSLESTTMDEDGNSVTLGSLLVGECDCEIKMDGKLDAERIFDLLPDNLKRIVEKRLSGQLVHPLEHCQLTEWAANHAMYLA